MGNRLDHQCHKDECDSEAVFGVRLSLSCRAPGRNAVVRLGCTIKVCDRHQVETEVRQYLLSDANREVITTSLMENGYDEPDFLSAKVEFFPLAAPAEGKRSVLHVRGPTLECDRDGCSSPAKWQIKQRFRMMWQRGKGEPLVEVLTKLYVCDKHRAETKAPDLLVGDGKSLTQAWLNARGVSMPDFNTMQIDFIPLVDGRPIPAAIFVGKDGPKAEPKHV